MKIYSKNGKKFLVLNRKEWEDIGLKFEEAKKKKKKSKDKGRLSNLPQLAAR